MFFCEQQSIVTSDLVIRVFQGLQKKIKMPTPNNVLAHGLLKEPEETKEIRLVEISSGGAYSAVYSELISALSTALQRLNIRVSYHSNSISNRVPNLIFGWYRNFVTASRDIPRLPANCILVNMVPLTAVQSAPWLDPYLKSLAFCPVVDYSALNCEIIQGLGNQKVFRFRFGYTPLTPFKFPVKHNDFIFYGKVTSHRKPILENLLNKAVPLKLLRDCWGHQRDLQIGMAAGVINIGKFDQNILEVYRLWQSLCLGTPVISERGVDTKLVEEWKNYVYFIDDIDDIIDIISRKIGLPDPMLYQRETSFDDETCRLLKWIREMSFAGGWKPS